MRQERRRQERVQGLGGSLGETRQGLQGQWGILYRYRECGLEWEEGVGNT